MDTLHYRDEIVRAVFGESAIGAVAANPERLDQLASALAQAERGKEMLCAKHYGEPAMSLDAIVRQVPPAGYVHDIWTSR
jgi:hypothetical protein